MNQMVEHAIAVIGMAGRFPGAENVEVFWNNICQSKESITTFSNEELIAAGIPEWQIQSSHYVKARGILDGVEFFDADFFGIPPLEAQLTDPQQRLFLECAFEALENAGYCADHYAGSIGVYGGTARSTYFLHHILPNRGLMEAMGNYLIRIGNEQDFLTTKVSHKLNLKGPSLTIQSACSTSLVTICVACNHLLTYQCDIALAGGVSIFVPQQSGYVHQEGMIFSPDGHCKPFDAAAQGTVPSNGVGIVVLKRLEDALADRDHIYAIVRGYGMNNDGAEKISYSAPSAAGQATAIESAIAMAEIDPATISYAETHGTATFLGDPIEIEALTKAFQKYTQEQGFCAIGSVKSNIGHSMEAAGIAGFIKAVLALHEKKIPPMLHFNTLNPQINSENSPFHVNTVLKEWLPGINPRRACVSSFGLGGTNAHVILEEAPKLLASVESNIPHLLTLSAKTSSALNTIALNLGNYLREHPEVSLADVAYTLQIGKKIFEHRRAIVCRNREEAIVSLLELDAGTFTPETPIEQYLAEMGNLWTSGAVVDWPAFWSRLRVEKKPSRIPLPSYPFEKKRHWIDPPTETKIAQSKFPSAEKESSLSSIEMILMTIWKQFLGVETIGFHDDFFALGGDSLAALQVISQIQVELGTALKLQMFYQFPTISQLAIAISQRTLETSSLVCLRAGSGHPPLFLIHGIDGNIFSCKPLAEAMTFQGSIFGIQANNSGQKEQTIEEIAASYIGEIQKMQPKGPYFLCGFSFGGIVAYEMARQLEQTGHAPKFLGIIDAINPQHDLVPLNSDSEMLTFLIELLEGKEIPVATLHNLASKNLTERLLGSIGLNVLPEVQQQKIFEQIQRHLKSLQHYTPESYHGNVVFFEAKERFFRMKDISLTTTWQPLIKGQVVAHEITGSHLNMLKPPHVTNLANQLDLSLSEAFDFMCVEKRFDCT
jgi:3-oxoacyl-(acyl-carrier-protein) synthase/thioesterase domain-containing protein/acyl carrier protein